MLENLLEQECAHCSFVDEPWLSVSGPHIKATCYHCGNYIKFVPQYILPSIGRIRTQIWELTAHDVEIINEAKAVSEFQKKPNYLEALMQYWRLYIECRKIVNKDETKEVT